MTAPTSLAADRERLLYFGSWDGKVYALDLRHAEAPAGRRRPTTRSTARPRTRRDGLHRHNGGTSTRSTPRTGRIRWKARSFSHFRTARVLLRHAGRRLRPGLRGNTDGTVYAFGAHTGHLLWARHVGTYVYTAPAVWQKTVYVGTYDGNFYALDAATGDTGWMREVPRPIHGAPTVMDGLVYFSTCGFCGHARLALREAAARAAPSRSTRATGKLVWTFPDGQYSPLVADEQRVYLAGDTRVYGLRAQRTLAREPKQEQTRSRCRQRPDEVRGLEDAAR